MKLKIEFYKIAAAVLTVLTLFSALFTMLKSVSFAAPEDEYEVMPLANYAGVHTWNLRNKDGSYNQTIDIQILYSGGTPLFTLDKEQNFDDKTYEEFAEQFRQNLVTEFEFRVTMDYYEGGNEQQIAIVDATYELNSLKDSSNNLHWGILFTLVMDPGDTFTWRTGAVTPVCLQVTGSEKEWEEGDPTDEYKDITNWRLLDKTSQQSIEAAYGVNTVELPGRVPEGERETYGDTLINMYSLQVYIQNEGYRNEPHEIREIKYSSFDGVYVTYEIITKDTFYWSNGNPMSFYIKIKDSTAPQDAVSDVRRWGLGANGSPQANDGVTSIVLGDRVEISDPEGYASTLKSQYTQIQITFSNYNTRTYTIADITYDPDKTNAINSASGTQAKAYQLIFHEIFTWASGVNPDNNKNVVEFYIVINDPNDPIEIEKVQSWYITGDLGKSSTVENNAAQALLPDLIKTDMYAAYAETIKTYTIVVNANGSVMTDIEISDVTYDPTRSVEGQYAVYQVIPSGIFTWTNGTSVTFYVKVMDEDYTPVNEYVMGAWGPLEIGQNHTDSSTDPAFCVWHSDAITIEDRVISAEVYRTILLETYDRVVLWDWQNDGRHWLNTPRITDIVYDKERSDAENATGLHSNLVYAYKIVTRDIIKWREGEELAGQVVTLYILVEHNPNLPEKGELLKPNLEPGDDGNIEVNITEEEVDSNHKRVYIEWPEKELYSAFNNTAAMAAFAARFGTDADYDRITRMNADNTRSVYTIDHIAYNVDVTREKCFTDHDCWVFEVTFAAGGGPDNGVTYYIVVYQEYIEESMTGDLSQYTVQPNEPENVTMNLFDYWTTDDRYGNERGNPWEAVEDWENNDGLISEIFNHGINGGHALKFFHTSPTEGDPALGSSVWDSINRYGLWNHCTTNARQNIIRIVESKLGEDGFPKLALNKSNDDIKDPVQHAWANFAESAAGNLRGDNGEAQRTESLAYLFDPKYNPSLDTNSAVSAASSQKDIQSLPSLTSAPVSEPEPASRPISETAGNDTRVMAAALSTGRASYSDVKGLLQMNQSGYYYYDSKLNFAEFDEGKNKFTLYDTWGVIPGGKSPNGQFFPFNTAAQVFSGYTINPTSEQRTLYQNYNSDSRNDTAMNHFFGFTMEVDFQQPTDGLINHGEQQGDEVTFKFAGDDDIWVFVDDVLVLDMGGTHSGVYGEINFATGKVQTGLMNYTAGRGVAMTGNAWIDTTLWDLFNQAGMQTSTAWKDTDGKTTKIFADGTIHTLKLFYMERGHWDSNFAMYFNLPSIVDNTLYKVDEDGTPLKGAGFSLYEAQPNPGYDENAERHTASEFYKTTPNEPLLTLNQSDDNGSALLGTQTQRFDFSGRAANGKKYYILDEITAPAGFRQLSKQIVLEYDSERNVFKVLNQYETGAYASFTAILTDNSDRLHYATTTVGNNGEFIVSESNVEKDGKVVPEEVSDDHQRNALLFAVPMAYANIGYGPQWYPLYGSNIEGYHTVNIYSPDDYWNSPDSLEANGGIGIGMKDTDEGYQASVRWALRHNLLAAALRQVADTKAPDWYFSCDEVSNSSGIEEVSTVRFSAMLVNLPGDVDRYLVNSDETTGTIGGADLRLIGLLVDAEALNSLIPLDAMNTYAAEHGYNGVLSEGDTLNYIKSLDDDGKYDLLQRYLWGELGNTFGEGHESFEDAWDEQYDKKSPYWDGLRARLDDAYVSGDISTSRDRGVNLVYISNFTRSYGSVIYIPNERRELRVLKQDYDGNPLPDAVFGLFRSFSDAANFNGDLNSPALISHGKTGSNGLLIFATERDTSPANEGTGFAELEKDWSEYITDADKYLWVKELSAPTDYEINEAIVQVYVGDLTIYANGTAYKADASGNPVPIDNISGVTDTGALQSGNTYNTDGVYILASVGKLFQSMEKFADPLLNSTLLDIDTRDYVYFPGTGDTFTEPKIQSDGTVNWTAGNVGLRHMHFWDRRALHYTSSDYSTAHHRDDDGAVPDGEAFAMSQNGFIWMRPTQTNSTVFKTEHAGEDGTLHSRRAILYMDYKDQETENDPLDISEIFSPVNIIVVQDERIAEQPPGPDLRDLPGIGGIGTTLFYAIGGALLVCAALGCIIIFRKR